MIKRSALVLVLGTLALSGCKKGGIASSNGVPTLALVQQGGPGTLTASSGQSASGELDFTLDFSNVQVGQTRVLDLSLGNSNLSGYSVTKIDGPTDPEYAMSGITEGQTITSGAPFQIQFKPFTPGAKTDKITLTTDAVSGTLVVINLTGTGVKLDITVVPPALDFGKVVVNTTSALSVQVTNQSSSLPVTLSPFAVTGNDATLFSIEGTANGQPQQLAPGGSVSITVDFKPFIPTTIPSTAAVILHFCDGCVDTTVNMRGQGVASALVISPIPLDFGFVPVGATKTAAITVANVANQTVQILTATLSSASGAFTANSAFPQAAVSLAPGQSQTYPIDFLPPSSVQYVGQLELTTTDSNQNPRIPIQGYGGGPQISCEPAALDYATVAVGAPVTQTVYCTNVGTDVGDPNNNGLPLPAAELQILPSGLSVGGSAAFSAHLDQPSTGLTAGQTAAIDVAYAPTQAGSDQGTLSIASNDSINSPTQVALTGQAESLPPCVFTVTPQQIDFGHVNQQQTGTLAFTVTDTGNTVCLISGLAVAPQSSSAFALHDYPQGLPSATLGPAGNPNNQPTQLTVAVDFTPNAQGTFTGAVAFTISNPQTPQQSVSLTGTSAPGCLLIAPNNLDFGIIGFNTQNNRWCSTSIRKINLFNTCNYDVHITQITQSDAADFQLTGVPSLPYDLPASASTTLDVQFTPQSAGVKYGSLQVQTQELPSPYLVAFHGNAENGVPQTDTFTQAASPRVDILFVLDTDDNGAVEQTVAQNLPSFMAYAITNTIDFHIGVTTSDDCSIELGRLDPCPGCAANGSQGLVITPETEFQGKTDPTGALIGLVNQIAANSNGCGDDLFQPAYLALTAPNISPGGWNATFLRSDAYLAIIGIDDGDNSSIQSNDFYFNFFESLKGFKNADEFSFSAVNNLPNDPSQGCGSVVYDGPTVRVPDMVARTGGLAVDICTTNWGAALTQLGNVAFGARRAFVLTSVPADPSQIDVKVGTGTNLVDIPQTDPKHPGISNWTYDATTDSVIFDVNQLPEAGQTIQITYPVACL